MEDIFSNLHSQIAQLTYKFKQEIDGVKFTLNELEKSLNNAWENCQDIIYDRKRSQDQH